MKGITGIMICIFSWLAFLGQSQTTPVSYVRPAHRVSSIVPHVENHSYLPAIIEDELILLPGQIDGQRGYFVLDTGAPSLIVNSRLVTNAGEKVSGQSVDGSAVALQEVTVAELIFRNRTHHHLQTLALDLSHLETYTRKTILGLLGREWLEAQPFLFDANQRHVLFLDKLSQKAKLAEIVTTFKSLEHIPVITLLVNGTPMNFGIDSGSSRNLLNAESLSKLSGSSVEIVDEIDLQSLSQQIQRTEIIAVSNVRISPEATPVHAEFVLTNMSSLGTADGIKLDGLIGLRFLSKYVFSIDYQGNKIYWWAAD